METWSCSPTKVGNREEDLKAKLITTAQNASGHLYTVIQKTVINSAFLSEKESGVGESIFPTLKSCRVFNMLIGNFC